MPRVDAVPETSFAVALLVGIIASAGYVGLATPNLGYQGAYYDEVQKAVPAFAWIDRPSHMFALNRVNGIPVMIMHYKAATEAFLYGALWLKTGNPFTIVSWRMFAIGAVAIGMVVFACLSRWTVRWWALALVLSLFALNTTVVLGSRLNWGPVALGLVENLLLLGVILRAASRAPASTWAAFAAGVIVGFATFDKLSRAGLVFPLAIWILLDHGGSRVRRIGAACAGGLLGALPLVVMNARSFISYGGFFSLGAVRGTHERSPESLERVVRGCLELGAGSAFSEEMLGLAPARWAVLTEAVSLAAGIGVAVAASMIAWRRGPSTLRISGVLAVSWMALVAWLHLLPETTHHNHWPLTAPFGIVAAVMCLQALVVPRPPRLLLMRIGAVLIAAALIASFVARISTTLSVQRALRAGDVTHKWDPGLNILGAFANARPEGTRFIAAGWGVATQIFCFAQGRPELIHELFWDYRGRSQLEAALEWFPTKDTVYLIALEPSIVPHAEAAARIFSDAAEVPGWREAPLEPELAAITCVQARKLIRIR